MRLAVEGAAIFAMNVILLSGCDHAPRRPATCASATPSDAARAFFAIPTDTGAGLDPNGIYPNGRRLAFMGYSGRPERDLTNGFSVAGPVYGNQMPYLERCFTNHWPVVAHVGLPITFNDKDPKKYKVDETALRAGIKTQLRDLTPHPEIIWWAIHPEELRPWRKDEMKYLDIVCDTIRAQDPRHRPIYLYNPNHRDAGSLKPIAARVDVLAKGCYVNSVGRKDDRAWVRWSVEQELDALRTAGRTNALALVMPELCRDPDSGEDPMIRAWVRHDVYLGLAAGARGVLLWSLFPRGAVKRTWQRWYDAYAECGRELGTARGLGEVFLFGAPRSNLRVHPVDGVVATNVTLGGEAETNTTTQAEREVRNAETPSFTVCERAFGPRRYLFVINSTKTDRAFEISGWPGESAATDAFDGHPLPLPHQGPLRLSLPPWGVSGLVFRLASD